MLLKMYNFFGNRKFKKENINLVIYNSNINITKLITYFASLQSYIKLFILLAYFLHEVYYL